MDPTVTSEDAIAENEVSTNHELDTKFNLAVEGGAAESAPSDANKSAFHEGDATIDTTKGGADEGALLPSQSVSQEGGANIDAVFLIPYSGETPPEFLTPERDWQSQTSGRVPLDPRQPAPIGRPS
jgi:hypothetical protein